MKDDFSMYRDLLVGRMRYGEVRPPYFEEYGVSSVNECSLDDQRLKHRITAATSRTNERIVGRNSASSSCSEETVTQHFWTLEASMTSPSAEVCPLPLRKVSLLKSFP